MQVKAHYIKPDIMARFRRDLPKKHRLIFDIGIATGLRVSDIISLRREVLEIEKPTIKEIKTGKSKRIYIPRKLRRELIKYCESDKGKEFIFFSDKSKSGHISRQAVFKVFKRVAKIYDIDSGPWNVGTHSMRISYACKLMEKGKSLKYIKSKLNHSKEADTLLYILDFFQNRKG